MKIELQTTDGRVVYASVPQAPEMGEEIVAEDGMSYCITGEPRSYPNYPFLMYRVADSVGTTR